MSEFNVIDENDIGTPSNGSSTQQVGILINDSIGNTIGGTTAGSTTLANVIGGNNVGIQITGFNSNLTGANVIEGNYIGVPEDGSPVGNLYGIWIDDVPFTTIGGTAKGAGNTISDNASAGVYISGLDATHNLVEGNSILGPNNRRTKTDPTNPLPIGVFIQNSSSNMIGGAGRGRKHYLRQQRGCLHRRDWRLVNQQPGPGQLHRPLGQARFPTRQRALRGHPGECSEQQRSPIRAFGQQDRRQRHRQLPRVLRLGCDDAALEFGPGLGLKGEQAGAPFQSCRASIPAAHGSPRAGNSTRPYGACRPAPETPGSSPPLSDPPLRPDHRHGADEDRAGDHPARGGSSD